MTLESFDAEQSQVLFLAFIRRSHTGLTQEAYTKWNINTYKDSKMEFENSHIPLFIRKIISFVNISFLFVDRSSIC